jgi:hypothetical protein
VEPGLHHAAEEACGLADRDQVVAGDAVAGVRQRLVVGPRSATEIEERPDRTVSVDDHVGEIDRSLAVACPLEHGGGNGDREIEPEALERDVRQAADEAHLMLVSLAAVVRGFDDEVGLDAHAPPDLLGEHLIDGQEARCQVRREAQPVQGRSL